MWPAAACVTDSAVTHPLPYLWDSANLDPPPRTCKRTHLSQEQQLSRPDAMAAEQDPSAVPTSKPQQQQGQDQNRQDADAVADVAQVCVSLCVFQSVPPAS